MLKPNVHKQTTLMSSVFVYILQHLPTNEYSRYFDQPFEIFIKF